MGNKNIFLCFDEKLIQQAQILMIALRESLTGKLTIYCVVTNSVLKNSSGDLNQLASYLKINLILIEESRQFVEFTSLARARVAYEKFLFPRFLPSNEEKVLYLDIDIVPVRNFDELFETIFSEPLAAVALDDFISRKFPRWINTANGGMNLFNCDAYIKGNYMEKASTYINKNCESMNLYADLVLNQVFHNEWKKLKPVYNTSYLKSCSTINPWKRRQIRLVHFIGPRKPWVRHLIFPWNFTASNSYRRRLKLLLRLQGSNYQI